MKSKRFIGSMNIKLDPISIYLTQRICVITWMHSNLFGGRLPIKKCDNPTAKMTCMPADKQVEEISAVKSPNPKRGALRISWQTCKATTQPAARARLTPKQECKSFHCLNVSEAQSFRSGASSCSCSKKHLQRDYTEAYLSCFNISLWGSSTCSSRVHCQSQPRLGRGVPRPDYAAF